MNHPMERIDAIASVVPPFPLREAHAHLSQYGRSLTMVELADCASPGEMLDAVSAAAASASVRADGRRWVLAQGARPEAWDPPRWPTLAALDRVTADVCAVVWCFDYHALMANSAVLALTGVDDRSPNPPGGIIERDAAWQPTGVLVERAALDVWHSVPPVAASERYPEEEYAAVALGHQGFREVHDLKSGPRLGKTLRYLAEHGEFDLQAVLFPLLSDLDETLSTRREWECERVRLGGAKVFVDGTLNSRTAWMLEPFADGRPEHPRGTPMMTPREIEDAVRRCDAAGLPMAAHAIGDGAVRAVLDAIEKVRPKTPGFRIEHAEVIDAADVPRFAELGVIASVQPCHLLYDIEALRAALPHHRLDRVLPLRELIDAGCVPGEALLFGSDVPIVRSDPEDSILAATSRRRADMPEDEAIAPEQRITAEEAWGAFRAEV